MEAADLKGSSLEKKKKKKKKFFTWQKILVFVPPQQ